MTDEQIFLREHEEVPVDNIDLCLDKIGARGFIVFGIGAGDSKSKRKPQPAFLGPWEFKHYFCETTDKFPSPGNLHDTMQRAVRLVVKVVGVIIIIVFAVLLL